MEKQKRCKNPVIIGCEMLSPLGGSLTESWDQALLGRSGIKKLTSFLDSRDNLPNDFPVTEAGFLPPKILTPEFLENSDLSLFLQAEKICSPFIRYGLQAVDMALSKASLNFQSSSHLRARTAITFTSAIGGLETFLSSTSFSSYSPHKAHAHQVGAYLAKRYGLQGPTYAPIGACASGNMSLALGSLLIRENLADLVICGAADFPLINILSEAFATMNGCLKYLKPEDRAFHNPSLSSRPFSLDRKGFVLAEGAACLLLASADLADEYSWQPKIEVAGIGMTSDAHHFVSPHLSTIVECMRLALSDAGVAPENIDYINAHAASTKIGDQIEVQAIQEVFGQGRLQKSLPISSNKSQLGHTMGASSAIEAAFCCKGLEEQIALPTLNYLPDPQLKIDCIPEGPRKLAMEFVLNNSFGFGGCNCCLVLKRSQ